MRNRLGSTRGSPERGQSLAEFAIVLPLLLVLVIGIIEFANAWRTSQIVTNGTREGARIGVLPDARGDTESQIVDYIKEYLANSGLDSSKAVVDVSCDTNNDGSFNESGACDGSGEAERINVQYDYTFTFLGPILDFMTGGNGAEFGTVTLDASTIMRNE